MQLQKYHFIFINSIIFVFINNNAMVIQIKALSLEFI